MLSFKTPFITCCTPRTFPRSSPPLIAPYWHDFDPRIGSAIYYRQTNDSQQLQLFHTCLSSALNATGGLSNFSPTLLFIATWDQVPKFSRSALVNSRSMVDCMLPHQECIRDESIKLTPVYTCLQTLSTWQKVYLHKHHTVTRYPNRNTVQKYILLCR